MAWDIYSVPLDGDGVSALVDVTDTPDKSEGMPSWSPSGAWIAFANGARDLGIDDIPFGGIDVWMLTDIDRCSRRRGTFDRHPSWTDGTER